MHPEMEIQLIFPIFVAMVGLLFMAGGSAKLAGVAVMRRDAERLGFRFRTYRLIGAAEFAGGLAMCIARFARQPWLGAVAAAGLAALMFGAMVVHIRAKDAAAKTIPAAAFALATGAITYFFAAN